MPEQRPADRLGNEVRRTCLVGAVDRLLIVVAGHHYNRQVSAGGSSADHFAGGVAVQFRHFDIEEHEIRRTGVTLFDRVRSGRGLHNVETVMSERLGDDITRRLVVVGNDDSRSPLIGVDQCSLVLMIARSA